ncbi:MAG: SCO family protein [Gemmataceae bacterium]
MKPAALFVALLLAAPSALAQYGPQPVAEAPQGPPAATANFGLDQRLNESVPLDLPFRDEDGHTVMLGDFFHGKPVVLVLAYYRCPMLCTQVLAGLVDSLKKVPFDAGDQFEVVAVSFDSRETPALAAAKKASHVEAYERPGAEKGWHFLTGEQASIDRLTQAVGFRYSYDPKSDQFAHASGITVLTPKGRIARYFYGIRYSPRDLRLGLVEASEERIGSPADQIMLYCFHYDPAAGKYSATVVNFVRAGALLTVLALGTFMAVSWRRDRRKARGAAHAG